MPKGYTIHALTEDDIFDEGTVIRWVASGRFTYAALKTPTGWFTTARALPESYQHVPQVVTYPHLKRLLSKAGTTQVEVATEWASVKNTQ